MNISSKLELKIKIFISCYDLEQLYERVCIHETMFRLVSLYREYNKNSFENGKRKNRATSLTLMLKKSMEIESI